MTNTFRGSLKRVKWINPELTWAVVIMNDNNTACGPPPAGGFETGAEYVMAGRWVENERFGRQFKYTSITLATPITEQGVKAYLKKTCEGVGPAIAQRLWDAYGKDVCDVLRTDPDRAASEISGLSSSKANAISEVLTSRHELEEVNIQLSSLLDGYGFRSSVYADVLERWGVDAPRKIRINPFCLLTHHIPSVGFRRVDKLFCDLNDGNEAKLNSPKRLAIAAWWALKHDASGHTWYNVNKIDQALRELGAKNFNLKQIVSILKRAKWIDSRIFNGQVYITDSDRARCEHDVAMMLADHMGAPVEPYQLSDSGNLTPHQFDAATTALSTPIGILCGTPGTGKTFTLSRIVRDALTNGLSIAVVAPTGKAAVRCTAAMETCGVKLGATTIHTLLAPRFIDGKMQFTFNANNLLPCDFIIIDESSMLDMPLLCSLLSAVSPLTRILLVGDPFQLPPVGWGQPMNDLIKQKRIGIGELTEIHRNSGAIVVGCQAIKAGKIPVFADRYVANDPSTNFVIMPAADDAAILDRLVQGLSKFIERGVSISDMQVIVPTNSGGKIGRHSVNSALQERFNPNGFNLEGNRFRVGDKAIILKNRMVAGQNGVFHPSDIREWGEVYVANGDVGKVIEVTKKNTFIQLVHPSRLIRVGPALPITEKEEERGDRLAEPKRSDDGTSVDVDLAYAITCHKSQGSGYPYVFVLLDPSYGARSVASRQWLYTGTSRGEKLTVWIGHQNTAKAMLAKVANYRLSFLIDDINALLGEPPSVQQDQSDDLACPIQNCL